MSFTEKEKAIILNAGMQCTLDFLIEWAMQDMTEKHERVLLRDLLTARINYENRHLTNKVIGAIESTHEDYGPPIAGFGL